MEKITLRAVSYLDEGYYVERQVIIADNKRVWFARDLAGDCPEDATLGREMTNASQIINLMKLVSGKEVEVLPSIHCETEEEFSEYENLK